MTIGLSTESPSGNRELAEYYNQAEEARLQEIRSTYPHNQLTIPHVEGVYTAWKHIQELFFNEQNHSNPRSIRQGIKHINQHLRVCLIARLFSNYLTKQKKAIEYNNSLCADIINRDFASKMIESSETAAIFLSYADRMTKTKLDSLSDRELEAIVRELNELKEESPRKDVKAMIDALITYIANYTLITLVREKYHINNHCIDSHIYQQLINNRDLLHAFVKIPELRQVLTAHQSLARNRAAADLIPEKKAFLEAQEEKFFTEEVERINAIFNSLEGFKKEDIQKIASRCKALRDNRGVSRSIKQELFEVQKYVYKLLTIFEEPKAVPVNESNDNAPDTSFLPKELLSKKTTGTTRKQQKTTKRSKRGTNRRRTARQQVASSSIAATSAPKPVKKATRIWIKELPSAPFPHHLFWDQRVIRWFRKDPECLQEESYRDLSPQEKNREHHFHSLPPCLDSFLDSEYAIRSTWQREVDREADDMYSIPMAVEYKDPYTETDVLEFGHHCTIVNPRTNVIYHRYFHRSERQTFYRTGLTKGALRDIWTGQKDLPKVSKETTAPAHKNNRPKEDVEKLYNRFTQCIVIVDKLYGLKITLFKPSRR